MGVHEPADRFESLDQAIGVTTLIGREDGQWVVYLEVAFPGEEPFPLRVVDGRIWVRPPPAP